MKAYFTPFLEKNESFIIDNEVIKKYGLKAWAEEFQLGTAGYRDLMDPDDFFSPNVPLNAISMSLSNRSSVDFQSSS